MDLLQKSISAKLCPTVLGQACMDIVANPPKLGEPSYDSWLQEKEGNLASLATRCRGPCTPSLRFSCHQRQWRLLWRLVSSQTSSMLSSCWRPQVSVSSLDPGLVKQP